MKSCLKPLAGAVVAASVMAPLAAHAASPCPDGVVRFGVEPYDTSARLVPIYNDIGKAIAARIGCPVKVYVTTTYNAEIEAMRSKKLEIGEFGPLGYVLAHQIAGAQAVAAFGTGEGKPDTYWASIVTYPGSGAKTMADLRGKTFAFSDPASTSGHLFPAYGMRKNGIDPDKDIRAIYAGSHTSSFEALYNHKVAAGELNSEQLQSATQRGQYKRGMFITLWKSQPIPTDPITVRGDLPPAFKAKLIAVLQHLDLSTLPEKDRKIMGMSGDRFVPQTDAAYDQIRDLVSTLHIDLSKLS